MKHTLTVMRYNLSDSLRPTAIFFSIYTAFVLLNALLSYLIPGGNTVGSDMAILIFLFVCGVVGFRYNFFFAMANNISRRDFFLGTALSGVLPSFLSAAVMIVINRLISLFYPMPTLYTLCFERERLVFGPDGVAIVAQSAGKEALTLLMSFFFLAVLGFSIYLVGFFISTLFYRMNKLLRMTLWIVPWLLVVLITLLWPTLPQSFTGGLTRFFAAILGITSHSAWPPMGTAMAVALLLTLCGWLLTRRAVLKK